MVLKVTVSPELIEGTDRRFDGYSFFDLRPEIPIEWFDKHIN